MKYTTLIIVLLCVASVHAIELNSKPVFYFGGDNYYNITGNQTFMLNETTADDMYWRLDGTNYPFNDWDMWGYGFRNVSNISAELYCTPQGECLNLSIGTDFVQNISDANLSHLFIAGDGGESLISLTDITTAPVPSLEIDAVIIGDTPAISSTGFIDARVIDNREGHSGAIDYLTVGYLGAERSSQFNSSANNNYMIPFNLDISDTGNYWDISNVEHYGIWVTGSSRETTNDRLNSRWSVLRWTPTLGTGVLQPDTRLLAEPVYLGGDLFVNFMGALGYEKGHYRGLWCDTNINGAMPNGTSCVYSDKPEMGIDIVGNYTGDYYCGLDGGCIDPDGNFTTYMYGYNGSEWLAVNATSDGRLSVVFG